MSLRAKWMGCSVWGAGIGADLGQPQVDGGTYTGPKVPYDISAFKGVTFLAMAAVGTDTALRIKFPMTDETKVEDGGLCVESATNKCSDDFGAKFNLPSNGTWKRITIRWTDATFIQEGWGAVFPWNPAHVTSIQIQSVRTRSSRTTSSSTTSTSSSNSPIDPFARRVPWKRARRGAFSAGFAYKGC